jgi:hypothetical protein
MARTPDLVTVVEIDVWDGAATRTLRLSDVGPVIGTAADPRLYVPIAIGSRIIADGYGDVLATVGTNGGSLEFALARSRVGAAAEIADPETWAWLDWHWTGRTLRVYTGRRGDTFDNYALIYTGRVDDLGHDTLRASVKIAASSIDLDDVLVSDLYPDDDTVPETIRNRPKIEVRGAVYNMAPILLSDSDLGAPLVYHVSRLPLADIPDVRVGDISWTRVDIDPLAGEWTADLRNGKFTLGGITGGLDVRCDALGIGWETMTTATLMTDLITEGGGVIDTVAMAALESAAPYRIGWMTSTEERNRLDAFDEIMTSVVGWWGEGAGGTIAAGVLDAPGDPSLSLTGIEIAGIQLTKLLPPDSRLRVERNRNWTPLSSFADAVIETDKQKREDPGIVAATLDNAGIKTDEPRAIDVPLIRSLVLSDADALAIRDRAARLFSVRRRMYEVKAWVGAPDLYSTVSVDYMMVSGAFRVHGVVRSFGGGPTTLQLWG